MRTSWLAAGAVVVILGLWMITGLFKPDDQHTTIENPENTPLAVEVRRVQLQGMDRKIDLHGQLEPVQHLFLKAETSGKVQNIPVSKGQRIKAGEVIVTLDQGGRQNTLAEARARVKTARSEQQAAESLRRQRLQSQLQLEQAEAALEAALAQLASIELDISNTRVSAPFDAIVNDLPIDRGALIERGDVVAELVDDSAFNVTAHVAQQSLAKLEVGQLVSVQLLTGRTLQGTLSFISSVADAQTRSFRVEARVDNTDGDIAAGVSAAMSIPVEQVEAAFISPSTLSLDENGELGVKAVDENNQVVFLPIKLISTSLDGAWVTGIPSDTRVITLGQGFVSAGEEVIVQQTADNDTEQPLNDAEPLSATD